MECLSLSQETPAVVIERFESSLHSTKGCQWSVVEKRGSPSDPGMPQTRQHSPAPPDCPALPSSPPSNLHDGSHQAAALAPFVGGAVPRRQQAATAPAPRCRRDRAVHALWTAAAAAGKGWHRAGRPADAPHRRVRGARAAAPARATRLQRTHETDACCHRLCRAQTCPACRLNAMPEVRGLGWRGRGRGSARWGPVRV